MKKIKIVALIGKSGAGKDYWLHRICKENEDVHEIISCTTRSARQGEKNGKNYYFLTDDQFLQEEYIEYTKFNGWYYGTRVKDLDENKVNVGVFNYAGIERLMQNKNIDLTVIAIKAPDRVRLIRQLERLSDSDDVSEVLRRYHADEADFTQERKDMIKNANIPYYCIFNRIGNVIPNETFVNSIIKKVKNK